MGRRSRAGNRSRRVSAQIQDLEAYDLGDLIDLHIADMKEVGKAPARSKEATLKMLKRVLGKRKLVGLDRDRFIDFGKARAAKGAGPVTPSIDIGIVRLVLQHAAAVHGLRVSVEAVDLARYALKRLGLIRTDTG